MWLSTLIAIAVGGLGIGMLLAVSFFVHKTGEVQQADRETYISGLIMLVAGVAIYLLPGLIIAILVIGTLVGCALIIATFNKIFPNIRGIKASLREWLKDE